VLHLDNQHKILSNEQVPLNRHHNAMKNMQEFPHFGEQMWVKAKEVSS